MVDRPGIETVGRSVKRVSKIASNRNLSPCGRMVDPVNLRAAYGARKLPLWRWGACAGGARIYAVEGTTRGTRSWAARRRGWSQQSSLQLHHVALQLVDAPRRRSRNTCNTARRAGTSASSLAAIVGLVLGGVLYPTLGGSLFLVAAGLFTGVLVLTPFWFPRDDAG